MPTLLSPGFECRVKKTIAKGAIGAVFREGLLIVFLQISFWRHPMIRQRIFRFIIDEGIEIDRHTLNF